MPRALSLTAVPLLFSLISLVAQDQPSLGDIARQSRAKTAAAAAAKDGNLPDSVYSAKRPPVKQADLLAWQIAGVPAGTVCAEIQLRGIAFELDQSAQQRFASAGLPAQVVESLRAALRKTSTREAPPVLALLVDAAQLAAQRNFTNAQQKLGLALEQNPDNASLLVASGFLMGLAGDWKGAAKAYDKAVAQDPKFAYAHGQLSFASYQIGDIERAESAARQMLALQPKSSQARRYLAMALSKGMQEDERETLPSEMFASVSEEDARKAYAYNDAGIVRYKQRDYAGALSHFLSAVELYPSAPNYRYNAGLAYGHLGDHTEAIAQLKKAVAIKPKHMEAQETLGWEYWVTKRYKAAADVYRTMLQLSPDWKGAIIRQDLVCALDEAGEYAEARKVEADLRRYAESTSEPLGKSTVVEP